MTTSLYILTAVLDPRFKQLPFLNDEKRDEAYSEVVKLAQSLSGDSAEQTGEDPLAKKQKTAKEKEIAMLLCGHGAEDDPDEPSAQRSSCDEMKDYLQDRSKVDTAGPLRGGKIIRRDIHDLLGQPNAYSASLQPPLLQSAYFPKQDLLLTSRGTVFYPRMWTCKCFWPTT